jgi:dUTP pyrophosphatase
MHTVKIQKLHPDAVVPKYQTLGSAGADLVSIHDLDIQPGKVGVVSLGFSVSFPPGYEIQIRPRSGLAANHAVTVVNTPGTVDSDYRGPMKVLLINHGDKLFRISKGDRVAQMVLNEVCKAYFEEIEMLDETSRGEGGFGSTGRN